VLYHQQQYDASVEELMAVCHREPKWAEKVMADLKAIEKADPVNRHVLLAEAKVSFLLKRSDDAVAALSQLIEVSPESFEQALDVYQRLLARDPDQPRVKMALAKALVINGRPDEGVALVRQAISRDLSLVEPAVTLLRLALERNPDDLESGYLLANLYCQRGSFAQGLEILRAIMQARPDQTDRLARELENILQLKPDLPQARYFMTEILIGGRKFQPAVANLEAILRQQPAERQNVLNLLEKILSSQADQLEALMLRSRILVEVGQVEPAVDGFVRAAEVSADIRPQVVAELEKLQSGNQGLGRIHEALGTIYFEMGKFPQARESLSQAVKLVADSETKIRLYFFLAESHLALRNEAKAEEAMDEVKRIMPDADEVYKALRRFSTRRLQVEIDKAYQAIQEAPDDQFKKLDLASKLLVVEKYEAAAKLLAFKPQDEEVARRRLLLLARAFLGKSEAYTAIELLRQVPLGQHPFSRFQMDVCYLLGQCYEAVGNYAGAVSAYRNIYMDQTDFRDVKRRMDYSAEKAVLKELGHQATMLEATAAVYG
jgi:tetratricopeptide (TPR) repeat protein